MAIDGKILLLGLVAAGGVLLIATSKKAKAATPTNGKAPVGPPLQGVPVEVPEPGSVIVVPDEDDSEPEDLPPSIVVPSPLVRPPGSPPPFVPPGVFSPPVAPSPAPSLPPVVPPPPFPPPQAGPPPAALPPVLTSPTFPGVPLQLPTEVTDILDAAGIPSAIPLPPQVTPPPAAPELPEVVIPPPATQEQEDAEQPTELADDTEQVLDVMLGAEQSETWKRIEPILKPWQQKRGLTADGKFGPGSAKRMAQETGLLPIVRFWPTGALQHTAVPQYADALIAIAQTAEEPRRAQLMAAAVREKGQGFGSKQTAISPQIVFDPT